ncbi:hypothetical protein F0562_023848 [Nyssa sinensis]|uniref:Uncharacterized protein n=1 Tax=Nyssa sinensis TaxID=561372 RepID=A0A5J5BHG0_9ASTE|nr:hypothetical protein F0562_023848 [Nyssa sinensis]
MHSLKSCSIKDLNLKETELRPGLPGFWGGLVPENAFNASALESLLEAGVLGLKEGLSIQAKYKRPLLVHAEIQQELEGYLELKDGADDARSFSTYLKTRPASCKTTPTCTKKDPEVRRLELRTIYSKNALEPLEVCDMGKSFKLMDSDPVGSSVSKQLNEFCFDLESPWIGAKKTEQWWRTTYRDELASLVAQRSLDLIENCDLPLPQNTGRGCQRKTRQARLF